MNLDPNEYGAMRLIVNVKALVLMIVIGGAGVFNAQGALAAAPKIVLALGDSLTAGYGLKESDAFVMQLQTALRAKGHDITVINGGVSGDTSAGGKSRLDWLLATPVDTVILELGANDGLRGLDPAQTYKNLDWILARLRQKNIPVVLSGMMAPPNLGADYGAEFNRIYPRLAQKYGKEQGFVFDPFFLQGVAADPTLNQRDGIHPTKAGVAIIVKRLVPKVLQALKLLQKP